MTELSLDTRTGLPEALRVLLAEYPRDGWAAHPQFQGLVSFWLERHMMFRQLMEHMTRETEGVLDGILARFVEQANGAIRGVSGPDPKTEAGALRDGLAGLERLIDRHLTDEEDLIVPVILRDGPGGLG
jgi:hypothetical protein